MRESPKVDGVMSVMAIGGGLIQIQRGGDSFYLEAKDEVDPHEYCKQKGLLNPNC